MTKFRTGARLAVVNVVLTVMAAAVVAADQPPPEPSSAEQKQAISKYITQKTSRTPAGTSIPKASPWAWAIETYEAVPKQDPKGLYAWVAEHLAVADKRYLTHKDVEERRKGLGLVCEACNCAAHRLKDPKLGVLICEAYVLPHLEDADPRHWKYLGKQNVIEVAVGAYAEAKDGEKMAGMLRLCIDSAHNRNTADAARFRLAQILDRLGKYEEALKQLKDVDDDAGVAGAKRLIPEIEKKLKDKK